MQGCIDQHFCGSRRGVVVFLQTPESSQVTPWQEAPTSNGSRSKSFACVPSEIEQFMHFLQAPMRKRDRVRFLLFAQGKTGTRNSVVLPYFSVRNRLTHK